MALPLRALYSAFRAARYTARLPGKAVGAFATGTARVNELAWGLENADRIGTYWFPQYKRVVTVRVWGNKLSTKRKLYYLALSAAFGAANPPGPLRSANFIRTRVDHFGRFMEVVVGFDFSGLISNFISQEAATKTFMKDHKFGGADDLTDNKVANDLEAFIQTGNSMSVEKIIAGPVENVYGGDWPPFLARLFFDSSPLNNDLIGVKQQILARKIATVPGPPDQVDGSPDYRAYSTDLTRTITEALMDPWDIPNNQDDFLQPPATATQLDAPAGWSKGEIALK